MNRESSRLLCLITLVWLSVLLSPGTSHANDVWLTPTSQQDVGGLEVASNSF
jgi:hypothetical protein